MPLTIGVLGMRLPLTGVNISKIGKRGFKSQKNPISIQSTAGKMRIFRLRAPFSGVVGNSETLFSRFLEILAPVRGKRILSWGVEISHLQVGAVPVVSEDAFDWMSQWSHERGAAGRLRLAPDHDGPGGPVLWSGRPLARRAHLVTVPALVARARNGQSKISATHIKKRPEDPIRGHHPKTLYVGVLFPGT